MISIIIPTYNEEKVIERTLSRLKSLRIPYELIVTDDKSTDATAEVSKKYADAVLVPESKHISIAANRNAGRKAAKGDILVFLDSTCIIAENLDSFFGRAISRFKADPKLAGLTGRLLVEPELETMGDKIVYFFFNKVHLIKNNVLHSGESSGKFQMIRASSFDALGGYNEKLITREDGDMFNRLSKIGKTIYDGSLIIYHSGRRAHAIGWPRLLATWMVETLWVMVFRRSLAKNWDRYWEKMPKLRKVNFL